MNGRNTMKRFIMLTMLVLLCTILCTSSLVYAEKGKGFTVKVKIEYNAQGQITSVEANGKKIMGQLFTGNEPVIGIPAQILLLEGDDPCVTHGGIKYCW